MVRIFLLLAFFVGHALAVDESALDRRVTEIGAELRCLVCQNQTIADSQASLAVDLRNQIREQLKSGKSEQEIKDYMVARYGDFVLYRPPLKPATVALWLGPFVLLLIGIGLFYRRVARRRAPEPQLSQADRERAAKLLE
ncbi:MAG: cytochrome c-type biogenesis protein CcmH [Betaproteobacteria bacterium]|nr:MAG: cytochrome c-type biogenesis protein CcmH [Betaproteobacteria bacterium]